MFVKMSTPKPLYVHSIEHVLVPSKGMKAKVEKRNTEPIARSLVVWLTDHDIVW